MTPERSKLWMVVLGLFSKVWPFFVPSPELAEAWDFALVDLTDDELAGAAREVMATQANQPTPADIRDAARGKLQWVDVWKRDAFGSVVLGSNGAPVVVGRQQARVKRGRPAPVLLSWGTAGDRYTGGVEPGQHPALVPHASILGLVEAAAKRFKPS